MGNLYRSKYVIPSNRADWWDYGNKGSYFVTLNTKNRNHFFGEIERGKMTQSELCLIAIKNWQEIPNKFNSIELGEFVFMPDHMHGVIHINESEHKEIIKCSEENIKGGITGLMNPMLHENLGTVIRSFKAKTTFDCKKINPDFGWLSNYHERIVRNQQELQRIENYIRNNIKNWRSPS